MSTISVHDVQGFSTYNNTVRIPNGHKLDIAGDLKVPSHTTATRPTAEVGAIGFNTTLQILEIYVLILSNSETESLSNKISSLFKYWFACLVLTLFRDSSSLFRYQIRP